MFVSTGQVLKQFTELKATFFETDKKPYLNSFDREDFVHSLTLVDIFGHMNKTDLIVQGLLATIIDVAKNNELFWPSCHSERTWEVDN